MNTQATNAQSNNWSRGWIARSVLVVLLTTSTLTITGCSVWASRPRLRKQKVDMHVPVDSVPPMKLGTLNEQYLLIMQAPNSGWLIGIDKHERIAIGMRIFVTVRRPDLAFEYPQMIVEKQMLTPIRTDSTLEIYARVLDADEKTDGRGYGRVVPVDQFEE